MKKRILFALLGIGLFQVGSAWAFGIHCESVTSLPSSTTVGSTYSFSGQCTNSSVIGFNDFTLTPVTAPTTASVHMSSACAKNIAAGATCTLSGTFKSTAVGAYTLNFKGHYGGETMLNPLLTYTTTASSSPPILPGDITIESGSSNENLAVYSQQTGSATVTVQNTGSSNLASLQLSFDGLSGTLTETSNTCSGGLTSGQQCSYQLSYSPGSDAAQPVTTTDSRIVVSAEASDGTHSDN